MLQALQGAETEVASETTRSSDEDNPVSKSLDLILVILNNLATLAEWDTKGNKEERTKIYGQSFPMKELILSRHSPLYKLK